MTATFLRIKSLSNGPGHIRMAARHNLRELQAALGAGSHIDAARMRDNVILAGPASAGEVAELADRLMGDAGVKVKRKDAVRAVEIVFSLPPETTIDVDAFFTDALAWARGFFAVPVLSAVIHKDEAAPHCHTLLLPLVDGRMAGSSLMGNRARLQAMQTAFFESVGIRYGLIRPKLAKRLNAATRRKAAELAFTTIVSDSDLLLRPPVESAILDAFAIDPAPLLASLDIPLPMPPKQHKSFVEIMTKPCKPEPRTNQPSHIGFASRSKTIGVAVKERPEKEPYVSVGFAARSDADPSVSESSQAPPPDSLAEGDEFIRCRDDLPAALWDAELGEFHDPRGLRYRAAR